MPGGQCLTQKYFSELQSGEENFFCLPKGSGGMLFCLLKGSGGMLRRKIFSQVHQIEEKDLLRRLKSALLNPKFGSQKSALL